MGCRVRPSTLTSRRRWMDIRVRPQDCSARPHSDGATRSSRSGTRGSWRRRTFGALKTATAWALCLTATSKNKGLLKAFFSIYKWKLVAIAIMQAISTGCTLFGPAYVLPQVILSAATQDWTRGVLLVVALYAVQMLSSFLAVHMNFLNAVIGIQFTACLRSMLFEKALKLSAKSRKAKTAGDIANLFSVDVLNVMALSTNLNMAWIVPIEVGVTLYLIQRQVGWAIWIGFLALFVILLITGGVGAFAGKAQRLIFSSKDDRMKVINELFGAIQIVKFNAWEDKLAQKVADLRAKELDALWFFIKTILVLITSMNTAPVLITVVVFATYSIWMGQLLTVSIVFTTLALFTNLQVAFIAMPMILVSTIQALVSVRRIDDVLAMEEIHLDNTLHPRFPMDCDLAIQISNGSFGWEKESPLFKNLQWSVRRGEFVVVHGAVGSGKSSLCSILLGEMDKYDGAVVVAGRVAYFGQQSWIQNASIRHNIVFGRPYDRVRVSRQGPDRDRAQGRQLVGRTEGAREPGAGVLCGCRRLHLGCAAGGRGRDRRQ
ncbi:hypothetical protein AaE_001915 [Aphanomyces astaci]|uniref:ABC transmembrane type-1 domain-containing protein n=1 Tax=Aphanomyces astaci TaxID=112090 RepID=A0A6A5ARC5_APHAT|nr:hypothetical protein AaE_001915 [Aphanomyces astaci]